jgi:adenylate kinase
VYARQTEPLIAYYNAQSVLVRIDGEQTPDKVYADLKESIGRA